ncbi:uncharacterized protein SOCE26_022420 [Sorangium cellulosum]|uniref:HTH merR-type domain-containing protein n=1 Tax=Sorangium cellulosum TaxID=56 RepID=A0A2L0ENF6_SORCE|nr:uncharacterized protein SOCE26_022420 [Sorangium cellulosum]
MVDLPGSEQRPSAYVTGAEAAALLGVKRETLYAYASRGVLRGVPGGRGRARLYLRADIERLKARHDARAGHGPVAAEALRWGEPVLESALTAIGPRGPVYRGKEAVALALDDVPFDAVAELLWTGELPEGGAPPARPARLGLRPAKIAALLPAGAPPLAALALAVPALGAHDATRHVGAPSIDGRIPTSDAERARAGAGALDGGARRPGAGRARRRRRARGRGHAAARADRPRREPHEEGRARREPGAPDLGGSRAERLRVRGPGGRLHRGRPLRLRQRGDRRALRPEARRRHRARGGDDRRGGPARARRRRGPRAPAPRRADRRRRAPALPGRRSARAGAARHGPRARAAERGAAHGARARRRAARRWPRSAVARPRPRRDLGCARAAGRLGGGAVRGGARRGVDRPRVRAARGRIPAAAARPLHRALTERLHRRTRNSPACRARPPGSAAARSTPSPAARSGR